MFIKIDEDLYKKIQSFTMTDYNREGEMIPVESIEPMLEDLICEIERLEEKYSDLEQDLQDNYKPISPAEMYAVSDKDFY
jgi:hypothetical protein